LIVQDLHWSKSTGLKNWQELVYFQRTKAITLAQAFVHKFKGLFPTKKLPMDEFKIIAKQHFFIKEAY